MKFIAIGDLHFGIKGFNQGFLDNQLKFFHEQLFPYMRENNIDTIVQLGDFLDNRTQMDIHVFDRIINELIEPIKAQGFKLITFLGNHDIYYKTKLDVNLVKYFEKLYPDTITVLQKNTMIKMGTYNYMFMPWLVENQKVQHTDLIGADVVFGHFEIDDFEMVKGHVAHGTDMTSGFFKSIPGLKRVISGHYHVQSTDGFVTYIGTPYQINWGDYKTSRGFFVVEDHNYQFIENTSSLKFIKLKYDDTNDKRLELSGYYKESMYYNDVEELPDLSNHQVKFFINKAKDKEYESVNFDLYQKDLKLDVVNNVEISNMIGTDFIGEMENIGSTELLMNTVKDKSPHLLNLLEDVMSKINED